MNCFRYLVFVLSFAGFGWSELFALALDTERPNLSPEQRTIVDLYEAGKFREFEQAVLANAADTTQAPQTRLKAVAMLLALRKQDPRLDIAALDKCFEAVDSLRPLLPVEVHYFLDHYPVDRFALEGNFLEAALAAERLRVEYQAETDRILMVYSEEPYFFARAGRRDKALEIVADTWTKFNNSYERNEAVRVRFAELLSDQHDQTAAFELLEELRESFPVEFHSNPYVVQNWLNYAVRAVLGGDDASNRAKLIEIAEYGRSAVSANNYARVRAPVYFCVAELLEKAHDVEGAKECYKAAAANAGDGELANNLRTWSTAAEKRFQDAAEAAAEAKTNAVPEPVKASNRGVLLICLNLLGAAVIGFLILFARRKTPEQSQ